MRLLDHMLRHIVPALGIDTRWLKEHLEDCDVRIRLTDGCVEELANDAGSAAWRQILAARGAPKPYLEALTEQLVLRAQFMQRWTRSDEKIDELEETNQRLVRIARKYALPRPWKLTEPVACEWRRPQFSWNWPASSSAGQPMPQT